MTQLQLVPTSSLSEKELVLRLIPKLGSQGSGHVGASIEDLSDSFERQFNTPIVPTLNRMLEDRSIIAVLFESSERYSMRKPRLLKILDKIPSEIPKQQRIRIYLPDHVSLRVVAALKKHQRLGEILKEVQRET